MSKNPDLPPGWAMPDDLAKQMKEALNRKSISPKDENRDTLDYIGRDIALIEPDPQDWGDWVIYLLDQLEAEANRRGADKNFEKTVRLLRKELEK